MNEKEKREFDRLMENFRKEKIKSDYSYGLLELKKMGFIALYIVVITLIFSDKDVNQNAVFAGTSAIQTILIFSAHWALVWNGNDHYNTHILSLVCLSIPLEFLIFGLPKDLIHAYRQGILPFPWKLSARGLGLGGLLSLLFPYIYAFVKLILAYRLGTLYIFARRINKTLHISSGE